MTETTLRGGWRAGSRLTVVFRSRFAAISGRRSIKAAFVAAALLLAHPAAAMEWRESTEVGRIFEEAGATGTFVLYDVAEKRLVGYNRTRAHERFIPASTFKIPNTLIGLWAGAVTGVDEVLPYGGKPQPFKAWEKDMSLREAIGVSNAAIYQELARRIGLERMREGVSRMSYGNGAIGAAVDRFWLEGPLRISAVEQTAFLARLAQDALPFPERLQARVREIVRLEQGPRGTLYGKTGWANAPNPGVGWWVGWVQRGERVYAFALNMDIERAADAGKRVAIGRRSLEALGVF